MANRGNEVSPQRWIGQQLVGPLEDAMQLARRYREVDSFHEYVSARLHLMVAAGLLLLVTALACAATPIMLLVGARPGAALAGLLLAPLVLVGSVFVLLYVFFSWIEERSLAKSLGHRTAPAPSRIAIWLRHKLGVDLGKAPRVPWLLAALFVFLPLAFLASLAPALTALLAAVLIVAPILYARLDR
jgi:hypothetical protein